MWFLSFFRTYDMIIRRSFSVWAYRSTANGFLSREAKTSTPISSEGPSRPLNLSLQLSSSTNDDDVFRFTPNGQTPIPSIKNTNGHSFSDDVFAPKSPAYNNNLPHHTSMQRNDINHDQESAPSQFQARNPYENVVLNTKIISTDSPSNLPATVFVRKPIITASASDSKGQNGFQNGSQAYERCETPPKSKLTVSFSSSVEEYDPDDIPTNRHKTLQNGSVSSTNGIVRTVATEAQVHNPDYDNCAGSEDHQIDSPSNWNSKHLKAVPTSTSSPSTNPSQVSTTGDTSGTNSNSGSPGGRIETNANKEGPESDKELSSQLPVRNIISRYEMHQTQLIM